MSLTWRLTVDLHGLGVEALSCVAAGEEPQVRSHPGAGLKVGPVAQGASFWFREESGECPDFWPGGVRHGGDVSLICSVGTERGKACPDTAPQ